jgi:general secretion pathway protein G
MWRRRTLSGPGGFTMVELLVVISVIVILASIGMARYSNSVVRAREAVLKEDLFRMRDAIDQYYADKTKYPSSLEDLVTDGYLREIPVDPFTNSKETWQAINAEANVNDTTAQPGIYDVKSGSEETSLDGTRYADWD